MVIQKGGVVNRECDAVCCPYVFLPSPRLCMYNGILNEIYPVSTNVSSLVVYHPLPQRWNLTWLQNSLLPGHLNYGRHLGEASTAWWVRRRGHTAVSCVLAWNTLASCSVLRYAAVEECNVDHQGVFAFISRPRGYFNFCGWCKFNHHRTRGSSVREGVEELTEQSHPASHWWRAWAPLWYWEEPTHWARLGGIAG